MPTEYTRLELRLARPPISVVEGIYSAKGDDTVMPDRMRMLEVGPCADSFICDLAPRVVVSDMFRSPEASLSAMQRKSGVQPPSYSRHNYGQAIDLAVSETLKRMKVLATGLGALGEVRLLAVGGSSSDLGQTVRNKRGLDLWMAERGWFCFRGDHKTGKTADHPTDESWHYDYFGNSDAPRYPYKNDRAAAWAITTSFYAHAWGRIVSALDGPDSGARETVQDMLAELRLYHGAIDGKIGPLSQQAVLAFQRAWRLKETGKLDPRTVQVLVYVTCRRTITEVVEQPRPGKPCNFTI
jgi:hypothetical protein